MTPSLRPWKMERECDAPSPSGRERLLDHAKPFVRVYEAVGRAENPDMLGDGVWHHAEQQQCSGADLSGSDFNHHGARALRQHLPQIGLTAVPL